MDIWFANICKQFLRLPFHINFCVCCEIRIQFLCFACRYSVFLTPFVKKTISFSLCILVIKDQLTIYVWVYFSDLYSVPLVYLLFCFFFFMPVPYCFDYCSFVVWNQGAWYLHLFLLSQGCFGYLIFCGFATNFRMICSCPVKYAIGIWLRLHQIIDCFGAYRYFSSIDSPNPWTLNIFPFFGMYSSISLICVLKFSECKSFTFLVRIIPRYFILFDEIVSDMFLIFFLLVCY